MSHTAHPFQLWSGHLISIRYTPTPLTSCLYWSNLTVHTHRCICQISYPRTIWSVGKMPTLPNSLMSCPMLRMLCTLGEGGSSSNLSLCWCFILVLWIIICLCSATSLGIAKLYWISSSRLQKLASTQDTWTLDADLSLQCYSMNELESIN